MKRENGCFTTYIFKIKCQPPNSKHKMAQKYIFSDNQTIVICRQSSFLGSGWCLFTSVSRRQAENLQKPEVEIRPCVAKIHYCGRYFFLEKRSCDKPYTLRVVGCSGQDQLRCLFDQESPSHDKLRGSSYFFGICCNTCETRVQVSTGVSLASQIIRTAHPTLRLLKEVLLM